MRTEKSKINMPTLHVIILDVRATIVVAVISVIRFVQNIAPVMTTDVNFNFPAVDVRRVIVEPSNVRVIMLLGNAIPILVGIVIVVWLF
jgi:hypothetical protein